MSKDGSDLWAVIVEKAWAKAKGNFNSLDGGFNGETYAALTNVPVFIY